METIKNVVGYVYGGAKTNESHEEPANGLQGAGNAEDPFDKGNVENYTAAAGQSAPLGGALRSTPGAVPDIHEPVEDNLEGSVKASDGFEPERTHTPQPSEQYPSRPVSSTQTTETPAPVTGFFGAKNTRPETDSAVATNTSTTSADNTKSDGIGSSGWLSTALPSTLPLVGGKSKPAEEGSVAERSGPAVSEKGASTISNSVQQVQAPATPEPAPIAEQTSRDANRLPPNHLPDSVPVGASTDLLPNQGTPETSATTSSAPTTAALPATSENTPPSPTPLSSELPGTKAPAHGSRFIEADSEAPIRQNSAAIPTAGGKPIGVTAIADRTESDGPLDSTQVSPRTSIGGSHSSAPTKLLVAESKAMESPSPSTKAASKAEDDGEELHGKDKLKAKLHKLKDKITH